MNSPNKTPKQVAIKISLIQALGLFVFFGLVCIFLGKVKGYAFLVGGLCAWLPAFVYALLVFTRASTKTPGRFVAIFYVGEFIKLILSACLVAIAVVKFELNTVYVLLGFIVTLMAFFVGASRIK
jgi:F0F1-type ATP synthase assembly protein I